MPKARFESLDGSWTDIRNDIQMSISFSFPFDFIVGSEGVIGDLCCS